MTVVGLEVLATTARPGVTSGVPSSASETASSTVAQSLARGTGFAFVCLSVLKHHHAALRVTSNAPTDPFAPLELILADSNDAAFAVALLSDPLNAASIQTATDNVMLNSQTLAAAEAAWCAHLGVQTIIVPVTISSQSPHLPLLARVISSMLVRVLYSSILLRIPLTDDGWLAWNAIRSLSLEFTGLVSDDQLINRWIAEPIKMVVIPHHVFLLNKKNYPVLSKRHQHWTHRLMKLNPQFLISTPQKCPISDENGGVSAYRIYIEHLHKTAPPASVVDKFAHGFDDYLQTPLQPLMDNLDSATYEVFEKDPVKYNMYENAIAAALKDRVTLLRSSFVVCVFGAGRGPLVDCTLRAAITANCTVKVIALEKNPNAIVILRQKQMERWGDKVTIIHADMRHWVPTVKADILVSELLGSFGDNELSPECLDGAQKVLKDDGISIPESYTTFITPISSSKLFNDVASYKDIQHFETPYVVKLNAINQIGDPLPIWTFNHPQRGLQLVLGSKDFNLHNTRFSSRRFEVSEDVLIVSAYFHVNVDKENLFSAWNVLLSINPATHSPDMSSWFPIFFPLQVPLFVRKGYSVDIHFWRLSDDRKVWYEWAVVARDAEGKELYGGSSGIHNSEGRSSWIGL
ncbi:Protein arginine N-methyltransferase 5 [Entophlyctis luteolus]|nr:Protein arginine N-methyltransferase 5 [Entophlyctis luteolus]